MEGIYKVNLIPNDLCTEECILQIADTLDNLNGVVDDVFSRLMMRIKQNMDKTAKLTERIEASRNKVEQLKDMKTAIKVFSSAKYPSTIIHEHYKSVFDSDGYHHEPHNVVLRGKSQGQTNDKGIQEKLHFYHVKVAPPKSTKPKPDFNLNAIIDDISTVGELLVFNTNESPYLGTISRTPAYVPRVTPTEQKSFLEDAPSSILNREVLKREADEYLYAPGMGMVPELEMPVDLPHLPGIAGDIQYSIATDGSIAPSVVTSPVATATDVAEISDLKAIPDLPDVTSVPELPVVPIMPDVPDATEESPRVQAPPPPPPPPPPLVLESPRAENGIQKPDQKAEPPAPKGDAHSNLMAAIRQAGGAGRAKLRSSAEVAEDKQVPPSGDLMADLHAKLSMRRRGISGLERGGTVLHTLASIIPEPDHSSPARSDSDDDWE